MSRPIGYYVHHHGDGHRQRALAIAAACPGRFILIGTGLAGRTGDVPCLDLPDDRAVGLETFDGRDGEATRPGSLHYAPIDHEGVRARTAALAAWIARERPELMVVDVSAEVAMLSRLAATPTVCVRLAGRREDPAHLDAFRGARALLSPFHGDLDDPSTVDWVRRKTIYAPGLTVAGPAGAPVRRNTVLFVQGRGGGEADGDRLAAAARTTSEFSWRVIGPASSPRSAPPNLTLLGWTDDPAGEIASAGVVVGAAGDGLVNAVLAAGRPFVCIPDARPFDEQTTKASRLHALGAALVTDAWPETGRWPSVLEQALAIDPARQRRLHDPDGAGRAAQAMVDLARTGAAHGHA